MKQHLGMCGIACSECPAFVARRTDDHELRRETAAEWSKQYGGSFVPADINCDGCTSTGVHFDYCSNCEIRKCGMSRGLSTCAGCDEYACEKLEKFFDTAPQARGNLDRIRLEADR